MVLGALFPAAILVFCVILGASILRRNRGDAASHAFALLLGLFAVWATIHLPGRLGWDSPEATVVHLIGDAVLVPLSSGTFLLFSLLFPRRSPFLDERWRMLLPYLPALGMVGLVLYVVPLEVVLVEVSPAEGMSRFVYRTAGRFVPVFLGVAAVPSLLALGVWVRTYLRSDSLRERGVLRTLILGIGLLIIFATVTALARAYAKFTLPIDENEVAVVSSALIGYAVLRYRILIEPAAETRLPGEASYDLTHGSSYLILESRPDLAYRVFADLVTHGAQGLCLTRTLPQRIRAEHRLEKTPMVWVGEQSPAPDLRAVDGTDEATYLVAKFLKECSDGVVLLDCLEYFIQNRDFATALRFLYRLKEMAGHGRARLLLSLSPGGVAPAELALLQKELEPLPAR